MLSTSVKMAEQSTEDTQRVLRQCVGTLLSAVATKIQIGRKYTGLINVLFLATFQFFNLT